MEHIRSMHADKRGYDQNARYAQHDSQNHAGIIQCRLREKNMFFSWSSIE